MNQIERKQVSSDIRKEEGFRNKPYKDSKGILTIGYGHNLNKPMPKEVLELLFQFDLTDAILDCHKTFTDFESFSSSQKRGLVNMMFNLGYRKMAGFRRMLAAIEKGDWKQAGFELLNSAYYKQLPERVGRIYELLTGEKINEDKD